MNTVLLLRSTATVRLSSITLSKQLRSFTYTRAMSRATRRLHQFMVYAPDYTDEGALQRRLDVRERHMTAAKGLHGLGSLSAYRHLDLRLFNYNSPI